MDKLVNSDPSPLKPVADTTPLATVTPSKPPAFLA